MFFFVQVGSTELSVGMASVHFSWLIISLLSANVCGSDVVKSRPVGIVELDMVNCCREVFIVIPWGSRPGIDIRFLFKSFDGERCFGDCIDCGGVENVGLSRFPIVNLFFEGDFIGGFGSFFLVGFAESGGWWHNPSTSFCEERDQAVFHRMMVSAYSTKEVEIFGEEERGCCRHCVVRRSVGHPRVCGG